MSTYRTVWGVKIYLDAEYTQDTDIGLYTSGGVSWFRWIESEISGTSETYKAGIIVPGGIDAIAEGGDFRRGGRFIDVEAITVRICNTAKFYNDLDTAGIGINGLKAEIIEFEQTVDGGSVNETVMGYFETNIESWSIANYELPLVPNAYGRNAPICTQVDLEAYADASADDIGRTVPATFGRYSGGTYAKNVRTISSEVAQSISILVYYLVNNGVTFTKIVFDGYFPNRDVFPVVASASSPSLEYTIQLGLASEVAFNSFTAITSVSDLYFKIAQDSSAQNLYRKISRIDYVDAQSIKITVDSYYTTDPTADADGNEAWAQIYEIKREYEADVWPCGSYLDVSGIAVSGQPEIYAYADNKKVTVSNDGTGTAETVTVDEKPFQYLRLPEYAYKQESGDTDNNRLVISPRLFDGTIDNMSSFLVLPMGNFGVSTSSDLSTFWDNTYVGGNGAYKHTSDVSINLNPSYASADLANVLDRDDSTYFRYALQVVNAAGSSRAADTFVCFVFKMPAYPDAFDFDSVYIGIRTDAIAGASAPGGGSPSCAVYTKWRKFLGDSEYILAKATGENPYGVNDEIDTRSMPDEYFISPPSNNNLYFYYNNDGSQSPPSVALISGYQSFEITGLSDKTLYRQFYEGGLLWRNNYGVMQAGDTATIVIDVYEIAAIFKKTVSIKDALWTTQYGRIFDDTWGSRKTSADIIQTPVDQYEHACRLQNWSDAGDTSIEYGKEYSSSALINVSSYVLSYDNLAVATFNDGELITGGTSAATAYVHHDNGTDQMTITRVSGTFQDDEQITGGGSGATADVNGDPVRSQGGFDSPRLDKVKQRNFDFQITNYDNSWTKNFKDKMLRSIWCAGYVDENGEECISYLPKLSIDTITDTVTYADVPDGMEPGKVIEPRPQDVYAEPFVRYNWNEAANRFDGLIAIKQVHRGTGNWSAAYTPGFSSSEGENFWEFCATELWARYHSVENPPSELTDQKFISRYDDAKWFLTTWLDWMLVRRITIPVYYSKARYWHAGRHIYLNLPHQTNGAAVEAVVEKIRKNKNGGYCELNLAYWVETPSTYYIQDVMYTASEGADADWQDTTDENNTQYQDAM